MSRSDDAGLLEAQRAVMRLLRERFGVDDALVLDLAGLVVRAVGRGHTGLDLSRTDDELVRLLDVADDALAGLPSRDTILAHLRASSAVTVVDGEGGPRDRPLVLDGRLLGTERTHRLERRVLDALHRRRDAHVDDALDLAAAEARLAEASEDQEAAVRALLRTNRSAGLGVLVGGPGTGKTRTVATLLAALQSTARDLGLPPLEVALAAPTGKAATRLGESLTGAAEALHRRYAGELGAGIDAFVAQVVGSRARTVHRLLGIGRDGVARRDPGPLAYDVVIVDESSMLDLALTAELLDALDDRCRLFLVGDQFQLQSVGAGSVLQSLVDGLQRPGGPVAALHTNHRLDTGVPPAHRAFVAAVREGDAAAALAALDAGGAPDASLRIVETEDPTTCVDAVHAVLAGPLRDAHAAVTGRGDERVALGRLADAKVLCAHRDGRWGVRTWWPLLREAMAATTGQVVAPGRRWLLGEPVLATANDPQTGLSNGDTGVVVGPEDAPRFVFVLPDGSHVRRAVVAMPDVESALAVTVHKSQGSEYDTVAIVLPPASSRLATRELLYTAVTRARRRVVLFGTRDAIGAAVERRSTRMGGLAAALRATSSASG
jgi:exodeoxyribonuclease V alpha subunit